MSGALKVLSAGPLTTIQDLGRVGYQRIGVPVGGALDSLSLRAANLLAGNAPDMGALEMAAHGPTLQVEAELARLALVGGSCAVALTRGARTLGVALNQSFTVERGDIVRIGRIEGSAVLYMAVEGGFDVPQVLGSVSTYVRGGLGGWLGRALRAGDVVPLARNRVGERDEVRMEAPDFAPPARFRVLDGPQSDHFSDTERDRFFAADYVVGAGWSRMGMRLEGPALKHTSGLSVTSDGVVRGSIQVPGDGLPIVLLAEHQTIGGYPKIGAVISADLPALGRAAIGARIAFERVSLEEAEEAGRALSLVIDRLPSRVAPAPRAPVIDLSSRLWQANLVSGVIDGRA